MWKSEFLHRQLPKQSRFGGIVTWQSCSEWSQHMAQVWHLYFMTPMILFSSFMGWLIKGEFILHITWYVCYSWEAVKPYLSEYIMDFFLVCYQSTPFKQLLNRIFKPYLSEYIMDFFQCAIHQHFLSNHY